LVTLAVAYIGLFVVLNDDRFLIRWRRTIKRVVIGLIVVVALSGLAALSSWIVHDLNDKAERAAQRAAWDAQRRAARQRWEQMSPRERGWIKFAIQNGAIPEDPDERTKLDELRDFVPEVYDAETDEEARAAKHANPPDIFDRVAAEQAAKRRKSQTPGARTGMFDDLIPTPTPIPEDRLFIPDSPTPTP
jgi:hypothetical protein